MKTTSGRMSADSRAGATQLPRAEVTSIIDRYLKYQPDRPRPAPALEQDDQSISYSLSEADMKPLEEVVTAA